MNEREAFKDWFKKEYLGIDNLANQGDEGAITRRDYAYVGWQAAKDASHNQAALYQSEINHLAQANQQWREKAAQAIPDGFVFVPKEPTREIIDALIEKIWHGYGYQEVEAHYVAIYKAMIEAAQEQK